MLELDLHLIPGSVVVRKECFLEVGIFNPRLAGIDDWDMWTRIAELRSILVDPAPVCIYRVASPGSGQGSSDFARHMHAAVKHQERLFSLPRAHAAPAVQRRKFVNDKAPHCRHVELARCGSIAAWSISLRPL